MTTMIVVLSGPKDMRTAAVISLMQQGWRVEDEVNDWGLTAEPDHTFITVHGPGVDKAAAAVAHFSFVPRLHWEAATVKPIDDPITQAQAITDLSEKVAEIQSFLRAIPVPEY